MEEVLDVQLRPGACHEDVPEIQLGPLCSAALLKALPHMTVQCSISAVSARKPPPTRPLHAFQLLVRGGGQGVPGPVNHISLNEANDPTRSMEATAQRRQPWTPLQGQAVPRNHGYWSWSQATATAHASHERSGVKLETTIYTFKSIRHKQTCQSPNKMVQKMGPLDASIERLPSPTTQDQRLPWQDEPTRRPAPEHAGMAILTHLPGS